MADAPTVFLIDDDEAVRDALALLLDVAGVRCETFDSARAFLDTAPLDHAGCLIVDVRMPGMSGLELQRVLTERGCPLPVIVLTGHGDVPMAVAALKAGAVDFLEKPITEAALLDSVEDALASDRDARTNRVAAAEIEARFAALTPREREVMDLVVAGHPNKAIAAQLHISTKTVEIHRARVMDKTKSRSVSDLVKMALRLNPGA